MDLCRAPNDCSIHIPGNKNQRTGETTSHSVLNINNAHSLLVLVYFAMLATTNIGPV
jgi:hypothetical protein